MTAKTGEEVQKIVIELERQKATRKDIIVPAANLSMLDDGVSLGIDETFLGNPVRTVYPIKKIAHEQFAEKTAIPVPYYHRMQASKPGLLAANVNAWIGEGGKNHLVRTLDGEARALLSDRFRTLDSYDLFFEAFPVLQENHAAITRADLTDEHFFLRALVQDWEEIIEGGWTHSGSGGHKISTAKRNADGVESVVPGILISNSDVGRGGLKAEVFVWVSQCSNGMVFDRSIYKVHTGRQLEAGFLSEETKELEDKMVWSQVRDLIKATFNQDEFKKLVASMNEAANQPLENPTLAVDAVVQHYGFSDAEKQAILNELMAPKTRKLNPGITTYGLVQAVTQLANTAANYEDALVYQRAGGEMIMGGAVKMIAAHVERELVPATTRTLAARKAAATRRLNRQPV